MKNILVKVTVSVLICTLITSIILGISTYKNKIYGGNPLWAIYIVFVYILIYSWWVFYLPAILSFQLTIRYKQSRSYLYNMALGIFWSGIWSALYLRYQPTFFEVSWSVLSNENIWTTFLMFTTIGAIYGLVYRKWLIDDSERGSSQIH